MEFPARAMAIVDALWMQHRDLAAGSSDDQRALTKMIAEQIAFELGAKWGCKSAGPGRPQGGSTLAYDGPPLIIWRWSDGDGHVTGTIGAPLHPPLLEPLEESAGQVFLPVNLIDHLGTSTQPPPRPAPTPPAPTAPEPDDLVAAIVNLTNRLTTLDMRLALLAQDVEAVAKRRYVAKFFGITLVSVPEAPRTAPASER